MQKDNAIQRFGIWTGVLLILGVLLPIIIPRVGLMFPNFELLGIAGIPFTLKIYLFFPIIGGILCFAALAQQKWLVRGILYLIAGFLPYLIGLTMQGEALMMGRQMTMGGVGFGVSGALKGIVGLTFPLGLIGLISAAFAGQANPQSKIVPWVALGGGALLGLSLLIPISMPGSRGFVNILISPITAIIEEQIIMAILMLILVVCLVIAAVSGIIWGLKAKDGVNKSRVIKLSLRIGFIQLLVFGVLALLIEAADGGEFFGAALMIIPAAFKMVGMLVGPFFAKCLGVAELIAWQGTSLPPAGGDSTEVKMTNPSTEPNPFT